MDPFSEDLANLEQQPTSKPPAKKNWPQIVTFVLIAMSITATLRLLDDGTSIDAIEPEDFVPYALPGLTVYGPEWETQSQNIAVSNGQITLTGNGLGLTVGWSLAVDPVVSETSFNEYLTMAVRVFPLLEAGLLSLERFSQPQETTVCDSHALTAQFSLVGESEVYGGMTQWVFDNREFTVFSFGIDDAAQQDLHQAVIERISCSALGEDVWETLSVFPQFNPPDGFFTVSDPTMLVFHNSAGEEYAFQLMGQELPNDFGYDYLDVFAQIIGDESAGFRTERLTLSSGREVLRYAWTDEFGAAVGYFTLLTCGEGIFGCLYEGPLGGDETAAVDILTTATCP